VFAPPALVALFWEACSLLGGLLGSVAVSVLHEGCVGLLACWVYCCWLQALLGRLLAGCLLQLLSSAVGCCWIAGLLLGLTGCVVCRLCGLLARYFVAVGCVLVAQLVGLVRLYCVGSHPGVPCCGALVHALGLKLVVHA
jgi:hypothetical protein